MNLFIVVLPILLGFFAFNVKTDNENDQVKSLTAACTFIIRDVVFILDGSQSISKDDFELAKKFIKDMMTIIKNSNTENRIAFIIFGDVAEIIFEFNKHNNLEEMLNDVSKTKNMYSSTGIGKALNLTHIELYPTMRKEVEKLVILFTDGTNNMYPAPYIYAERLKDARVQILTIGIGSDINSNELTRLASTGLSLHVESFSGLLKTQSQVVSHICPIPDPGFEKPCTLEQQDLVVILDSSNSIGKNEYEQAKSFLEKFLNTFELGPDKNRVAMLSFSDEIRLDFEFKEYYNNKDMINKVKSLESFGGATGIGRVLREVDSQLITQQRPNVPFNILLITDGVNNMYPRPLEYANSLKKKGANIIVLGIGEEINLKELKMISSEDKILTVETYGDLKKSLKTVIKTIICG